MCYVHVNNSIHFIYFICNGPCRGWQWRHSWKQLTTSRPECSVLCMLYCYTATAQLSSQRLKINWPQPIYTDRSEQQKPKQQRQQADGRAGGQATVKNGSKQQTDRNVIKQIECKQMSFVAQQQFVHFSLACSLALYHFCNITYGWLLFIFTVCSFPLCLFHSSEGFIS